MVGKNRTLKLHTLDSPIGYCYPRQKLSERVSAGNPAIDVMTDLEYVAALTIGLNVTIDDALELMTKSGVRLLFVANESGMVSGLVTANDIQGEKPMKVLHEVGGKHSGILVRDVMTPWGRLEVLQMDDVIKASVGDIIATLKQAGSMHWLLTQTKNVTRCALGVFFL
ncbi:MAG: hypothetical protein BMS9Abin15_0522 [Gammaproteobacteria bacterium]|nr:MAG: hypothetical protein BMS9Abin15_0522 [Gammaproteobacteria bacterium]